MSVPLFHLAPDLIVSKLCFGTMTFGEQNSLPQSFRLLDEAFEAGVNFFDSAEMYPVPQRRDTQGRSEKYLGRWIRERKIPRDRVVVATKVTGPSGQMTWIREGPKSLDANNILEAIDNSLLRMSTDYIDVYQIHWPDRYVPMFGETEYDPSQQYASVAIEEQLGVLRKAVDAGKIRYIGLSNETPYGVMKFLQLAGNIQLENKLVSLQNAYNLLCRNFDTALAECCHHERERVPMKNNSLSKFLSPVASESAFSTSGRIISPHRSRLHPDTVEVIMCTQNWLWAAEKRSGMIGVMGEIADCVLNEDIDTNEIGFPNSRSRIDKVKDGTRWLCLQVVDSASPMAMGILSGKYFTPSGGPSDARMNLFRGRYSEGESRYNLSKPILKSAVQEYVDIAIKYGLSPASLAIAFVLKHPLVASAIFGATKPWQLREVLQASKIDLTTEIIAEINKVHARYPNPCP